jgi:hypothetical protein
MRTTQWSLSVLGVAAAIEAVTGLVMILFSAGSDQAVARC